MVAPIELVRYIMICLQYTIVNLQNETNITNLAIINYHVDVIHEKSRKIGWFQPLLRYASLQAGRIIALVRGVGERGCAQPLFEHPQATGETVGPLMGSLGDVWIHTQHHLETYIKYTTWVCIPLSG